MNIVNVGQGQTGKTGKDGRPGEPGEQVWRCLCTIPVI